MWHLKTLHLLSTPASENWRSGMGSDKECDQSQCGERCYCEENGSEVKKNWVFSQDQTSTGKQSSKRHTSAKLSVRLTVCSRSGGARDQTQRTQNEPKMGTLGTFLFLRWSQLGLCDLVLFIQGYHLSYLQMMWVFGLWPCPQTSSLQQLTWFSAGKRLIGHPKSREEFEYVSALLMSEDRMEWEINHWIETVCL